MLLNHKFYTENKSRILKEFFPDDLASLYHTIHAAHEKYDRDLTLSEIRALHAEDNPTMTTAKREALAELFRMLNETEPIGLDVGHDVLKSLFKKEIGRQIADEGLKISEGVTDNLLGLRTTIGAVSDDFLPVSTAKETPLDVDDVLGAFESRAKWHFNISSLNDKIPGAGPGDFIIIFARPEVGKTAAWVSLVCGPGGFLEQGAKVLAIVNEEPAIRTVARGISCYTGKTFADIKADPASAKAEWAKVKSNLTVIDDGSLTLDGLDTLCQRYKPDVVVADQLDKIGVSNASFAREDQKLLFLYTESRNISKRNSCLFIGLSQASAEAENKTLVHFSMMDNSKTGKAAQADIIMGIGMHNMQDGRQEDDRIRHW